MNAKPNVSDWQHIQNRLKAETLRAHGFKIEVSSQSYRVDFNGKFIGGAGSLKKPHGRYAEADIRDHLASALSIAENYWESISTPGRP